MNNDGLFHVTPGKLYICISRGISSSGRAFAWHAKGDRFDPGILHKPQHLNRLRFFIHIE